MNSRLSFIRGKLRKFVAAQSGADWLQTEIYLYNEDSSDGVGNQATLDRLSKHLGKSKEFTYVAQMYYFNDADDFGSYTIHCRSLTEAMQFASEIGSEVYVSRNGIGIADFKMSSWSPMEVKFAEFYDHGLTVEEKDEADLAIARYYARINTDNLTPRPRRIVRVHRQSGK